MAHNLFEKAEYVLDNMLWPQVWAWDTYYIEFPDVVRGWEEVPADLRLREAVEAWQEYSDGIIGRIAVRLIRNTGLVDSGTLIRYATGYGYDTYPINVTTKREYKIDDIGVVPGLAHLIGTGTAALTLDSSVPSRNLSMEDQRQGRQPPPLAQLKWQDFLRQRQQWFNQLKSDIPNTFKYVG